MPEITVGFKTDVGRVRTQNQDSLAILSASELSGKAQGLFIVADGVGGNRKGGEVASRLAVDTLTAALSAAFSPGEAGADSGAEEQIQAGLKAANTIVWQQGRRVYEQRGMGTTCVLALVQDNRLIVGNVGDSRCYRLREGRLEQLTHDHAFLDAGRGSRQSSDESGSRVHFRHVMTRGIGFASVVEPEVEAFALREGDTLLLCSDGLTRLLEHEEIAARLKADEPPQTMCDKLVVEANAKGGDDNITLIVVQYGMRSPADPAPANSVAPHAETGETPANVASAGGTARWRKRLQRILKRQR